MLGIFHVISTYSIGAKATWTYFRPFVGNGIPDGFLTSLISDVANDQVRVKTDFRYFSKKWKEKQDLNFLVS